MSEGVHECLLHTDLESPETGNTQKAGGHAASPEGAQGKERARPGFSRPLGRSAGVTFQGATRSCVPQDLCGRLAGQDRRTARRTGTLERASAPSRPPRQGKGLRAYDRFASGLRRLPERPDQGSADYVLDRQGLSPCPSGLRPRPETRPLASPAWRAGRHPVTTRSRPGQVNGRLGLS